MIDDTSGPFRSISLFAIIASIVIYLSVSHGHTYDVVTEEKTRNPLIFNITCCSTTIK